MIKILLFDFGGVLTGWGGPQGLLELTKGKLNAEEARKFWIASKSIKKLESARCTPLEFAADAVRELGLDITAQAFLEAFISWGGGPLPGAPELLDALKPRFTLVCLSNNNEIHWNAKDKAFLARFHHLYPSHLTGLVKPAPEAFQNVVSDLKALPREILFFDDNPECVETAKSLGMQACRVKGIGEVKARLAERGLIL